MYVTEFWGKNLLISFHFYNRHNVDRSTASAKKSQYQKKRKKVKKMGSLKDAMVEIGCGEEKIYNYTKRRNEEDFKKQFMKKNPEDYTRLYSGRTVVRCLETNDNAYAFLQD